MKISLVKKICLTIGCFAFCGAFMSIQTDAKEVYAEKPILSVLGDSISSYSGYEEVSYYGREGVATISCAMNEEDIWWSKFAKANDLKIGHSSSVAGSEVAKDDNSYFSFNNRLRINRLNKNGNPDYIVVFGGINDSIYNRADQTRYSEKYNELVGKIKNAYGDARLILVAPYYFKEDTANELQANNNVIGLYDDSIQNIAKNNNAYYVDLRNALEFGNDFSDKFEIHPNKNGMEKIALAVENAIKNSRPSSTGIESVRANLDCDHYVIKVNAYSENYDGLQFKFKLVNDNTGEVIYDEDWSSNNCFVLDDVNFNDSYTAYVEIDANNDGIAEDAQIKTFNELFLDKPINVYNGVDYSSVYDYYYYLEHNPDLYNEFKNNSYGSIEHFVNSGISEGRPSKATFDVESYRNQYADLRQAFGWNNLSPYYYHYMYYGVNEGRKGTGCSVLQNPIHTFWGIDYSAVYDYEYYKNNNYDVFFVYGNDDAALFYHFITNGMHEGRKATKEFDVWKYAANNYDLVLNFGFDLSQYYIHYIVYGKNEGRITE